MSAKRWLIFFASIALGVSLGLLYGWVISPVEYTDTTPDSLRADFRADYTLMVAEVYDAEKSIPNAAQRMALLGSAPPAELTSQALEFARQNGYGAADVTLLENLLLAFQLGQP
jgi:hypothetical protein